MLSDITLGQYFPGRSVIHRLDPRIKIISIIFLIVAVFTARNYYSLALICAFSAALVTVSGIGIKMVLKSIKPVLFILIFTTVANLLWTSGENLIFQLGPVKIYLEGVAFAVFMALRIVCLIIITFVMLTYTTSPVSLTDAIERLLSPLAKIKLPVHEFSMMMSIALRFIPTLLEETDKIISAQKARGADFETGSLKKRVKALVPIFVPLFVSAFRRADELANAMECRLYRGGVGRTRMKILKITALDVIFLLCMTALPALVIYVNTLAANAI
jgi:energy-coupling factor transport system permease protein